MTDAVAVSSLVLIGSLATILVAGFVAGLVIAPFENRTNQRGRGAHH